MEVHEQRACFRFYAELNDFLPPQDQGRTVLWHYVVPGSVKDAIESLGPPHTEVELVLANNEPVDFDYRVQAGDRIAVYPRFRQLNLEEASQVRPAALGEPRFVLDTHLGRLPAYLRMGFDAVYRNDFTDEDLAQVSSRQRRFLLTRDLGLLIRRMVTYGYYLRETTPRRQLLRARTPLRLGRGCCAFSTLFALQ